VCIAKVEVFQFLISNGQFRRRRIRYVQQTFHRRPKCCGCCESIYALVVFLHCITSKFMSYVFWDVKPYSLLKVNRRFGGTFYLHLQGRRISRARNKRENRWQAEQKIETCSSRTSDDLQCNTCRNTPENSTVRTSSIA
jgi:hypothetical protein